MRSDRGCPVVTRQATPGASRSLDAVRCTAAAPVSLLEWRLNLAKALTVHDPHLPLAVAPDDFSVAGSGQDVRKGGAVPARFPPSVGRRCRVRVGTRGTHCFCP
jgi:hypothetical protein